MSRGPAGKRSASRGAAPAAAIPEPPAKRRIGQRGKDNKPESRRYKVMRLPPKVRAVIFHGYAEGDTYEKIRADVEKIGYRITTNAIGKYWRNIWQAEHKRLRETQTDFALLKQALALDENSPSRKIAEELLYRLVFQAYPLLRKEGPLALLREAREQAKGGEEKNGRSPGRHEADPVEQAREVRRRWRQLYGLEAADDAEEEKAKDPED